LHHIARTLNWAGSLAAVIVCIGGVLGPDVHGLLHAQSHGMEAGEACAFDGDVAHLEDDRAQTAHDDCTLCQRVEVALDLEEVGIHAPTERLNAVYAWNENVSIRHETPDRGRGPPARS
jgi:hypothetical protein